MGRCFKPLKPEPQEVFGDTQTSTHKIFGSIMVLEWSLTQEWKVILHRNPNKLPKISGHFFRKLPNSWLLRLLWSFLTFKAGIKNGGSTSYLVLDPDQPSSESLKNHHWKSNWIISSVTAPTFWRLSLFLGFFHGFEVIESLFKITHALGGCVTGFQPTDPLYLPCIYPQKPQREKAGIHCEGSLHSSTKHTLEIWTTSTTKDRLLRVKYKTQL